MQEVLYDMGWESVVSCLFGERYVVGVKCWYDVVCDPRNIREN